MPLSKEMQVRVYTRYCTVDKQCTVCSEDMFLAFVVRHLVLSPAIVTLENGTTVHYKV